MGGAAVPASIGQGSLQSRPARKQPMVPYDSPADSNEPTRLLEAQSDETAPRTSILSASTLLFGVALIALGTVVARSQQQFDWLPDWAKQLMVGYIAHNHSVLVGGAIIFVGIVAAGLGGRRGLPDRLSGLALPLPRLRLDVIALVALALAVVCNGLLYSHLSSKRYTHWDIALFFAGLALTGIAVHRLDRPARVSTLRFTLLDAALAVGAAVLSAALNSINLITWNFAWIGDEGSFFGLSHAIANGQTDWNFFYLIGVHAAHPIADSAYTALALKIFPDNIVGWRLGEVVVVSATAALIYLVGTALYGRFQGVVAAIILGSSHYLMAFTRIAYNNMHAIFYATLVMLLLVLAWRTQRAIFVYATGVAVGMCLYTFQVATLTGPIVAVLLLVIFVRRPSWSQVTAGALMLVGFVLAVVPGLLATTLALVVDVASRNTYPQVFARDPGLVVRTSIIDSTVAIWSNEQWRNHFVAGPLVDPITGVLLAAGIGIALLRINRRAERLALVWFAGGLLLVALTRLAPEAHVTRLLYIVPPAALLASLAVTQLGRALVGGLRVPRKLATSLVLVPVAVMPALNFYILHVEGPANISYNSFVLLMKIVMENPEHTVTEIGAAPNADDNLLGMFSKYPWLEGRYNYMSVGALPTVRLIGQDLSSESRRIFYVNSENGAIVEQVQKQLPPQYVLRELWDATKMTRVWMFSVNGVVK